MSAPVFELPKDSVFTDVKTAVDAVPDTKYPPSEKRSRPGPVVDKDGMSLVAGDVVNIPQWGEAKVIGHGIGVGNILLAYVYDGILAVGTFPVSYLMKK
jgi:hypothetical protein